MWRVNLHAGTTRSGIDRAPGRGAPQTRLRKLALLVLQVNIARRQVNIGQARVPAAGAETLGGPDWSRRPNERRSRQAPRIDRAGARVYHLALFAAARQGASPCVVGTEG
jgi:hypothetical protein